MGLRRAVRGLNRSRRLGASVRGGHISSKSAQLSAKFAAAEVRCSLWVVCVFVCFCFMFCVFVCLCFVFFVLCLVVLCVCV